MFFKRSPIFPFHSDLILPLPSEPGSSPSEALLGCGDSYDKESNIVEASGTGLLSSMMEKRSSHGCQVGFFTNTKAFLWPGALKIIFGLCRVLQSRNRYLASDWIPLYWTGKPSDDNVGTKSDREWW